jgi:XTP/dITP diphosphohydrolase
MKLLLASNNKNKMAELRRILEPMGFEVVSPVDVGLISDANETGTTFAENARIKARAIHDKTGLPTVADDSGLCVDALGGRPGVYSAIYGGEDLPHGEKIKLLLSELEGIPQEKRSARFACAICCILPHGEIIETYGECEGMIATEPTGSGGFGYDPVFMVGNKSFGELDASEKDKISHRSAALRQLEARLRKYIGYGT